MERKDLKRKPNWKSPELTALSHGVSENIRVLKGKFGPGVTNDMKNKVWDRITQSVNAVNTSGISRNPAEVKKKWQDMQSITKKKEAERVKVMRLTGGGPPPDDDASGWETVVIGTLPKSMVEGINGGVDTSEPTCMLTQTSTYQNDENPCQILEKAQSMKKEIKDFLKNYKPGIPLPKIGISMGTDFKDTTESITEEERDTLTSYICSFNEVNFECSNDIPTLIHETISFIIHFQHEKETTTEAAVPEENAGVFCVNEDIHREDVLNKNNPEDQGLSNVRRMPSLPAKKQRKGDLDEVYDLQCQVFRKELLKQDKEIEKLDLQIKILKRLDEARSSGSLHPNSPSLSQLFASIY